MHKATYYDISMLMYMMGMDLNVTCVLKDQAKRQCVCFGYVFHLYGDARNSAQSWFILRRMRLQLFFEYVGWKSVSTNVFSLAHQDSSREFALKGLWWMQRICTLNFEVRKVFRHEVGVH